MGPLAIPLIGAGASLLGDALGFAGGERANAANAKQAQMNRDFQERMSSTSYQRAVKDMQAAGLNPALAYQQGGASSPTGSTATMDNTLQNFRGSARGAAETAQNIQLTRAQQQQIMAQTAKTNAEAAQIKLESAARLASIQAQISAMGAQTAKTHTETDYLGKSMWDRLSEQRSNANWLAYSLPGRLEAVRLQNNLLSTNAREGNLRGDLLDYQKPLAENLARAQSSKWMKNFSPYLNDARTITQIGMPIFESILGPLMGKMGRTGGNLLKDYWDDIMGVP